MPDLDPSLSALPAELVLDADQTVFDAGRKPGFRNIAILMKSQVIRVGLECLLRQVPSTGTVLALAPERLHTPYRPHTFDILIVASEQWHLLDGAQDDCEHPLPPVLVLGDPLPDRGSAGFATLPSDGFLSLAELSLASLADALERTLAGEVPMPAALARELLSMHRLQLPQNAGRVATLTPRESETLQLMASGMSNKQIARTLAISPHGAKRLVGSVLAKFDAPNRTAAVVCAANAGLVCL